MVVLVLVCCVWGMLVWVSHRMQEWEMGSGATCASYVTLKCEACLTSQRLNAEEISLCTYVYPTLELALVTLG